jgi:hypothetical protein
MEETMKKNYLFVILAFLWILVMSCRLLTGIPSDANPTPSNQAQSTQTIPAEPLLVATQEPAPSQTLPAATTSVVISDLTNTHWVGRIYNQDNVYIFEVFETIFLPGGKLRYYIPNDWYENGTWQKKGNNVTLEWGNHACDFYGLLSGDTIAGAQKCVDTGTRGWWVKLKTP